MANTALLRTKILTKLTPNLITRPFTTTSSEPRKALLPKFINTKNPDTEPGSDPNHFNFVIPQDTKDPKYLLNLYHEVRAEGLIKNAIKVFDEIPKREMRLTQDALELYVKDNGQMPDVLAHIAVVEAYANAGQHNEEAHKVYLRMLAPGVIPNAYTYSVLIKSFASVNDWKMHGKAMQYVLEMLSKGMRPDAGTCVAVFETFAKKARVQEAKEMLQEMKRKGFIMDEKDVVGILRKRLKKQEALVKTLVEIFFNK